MYKIMLYGKAIGVGLTGPNPYSKVFENCTRLCCSLQRQAVGDGPTVFYKIMSELYKIMLQEQAVEDGPTVFYKIISELYKIMLQRQAVEDGPTMVYTIISELYKIMLQRQAVGDGPTVVCIHEMRGSFTCFLQARGHAKESNNFLYFMVRFFMSTSN